MPEWAGRAMQLHGRDLQGLAAALTPSIAHPFDAAGRLRVSPMRTYCRWGWWGCHVVERTEIRQRRAVCAYLLTARMMACMQLAASQRRSAHY